MGIRHNEVMVVNGRLTQVGLSFKTSGKRAAVFKCECGNSVIVYVTSVQQNNTKSCGCLRNELLKSGFRLAHGKKHTPEYSSWCNMWSRVRGKSGERSNRDYHGRGITCCERWKSFESFLEDMGERPGLRYSIGRIDNDGSYCPENCRWETDSQQSRNTRKNVILTLNGESKCVEDWAVHVGIKSNTLIHRLKKGWTTEDVLLKPLRVQ